MKESDILTAVEAAALIGRTSETLRVWKRQGIGPKWRFRGRTLLYFRQEVALWLAANQDLLDRGELPINQPDYDQLEMEDAA